MDFVAPNSSNPELLSDPLLQSPCGNLIIAVVNSELHRPKRRSFHETPQRRHRRHQDPIRQLMVVSIPSPERKALRRRPLHIPIVADDAVPLDG